MGWGIAGGRDGMGYRGGQDPTRAPLENVAGGVRGGVFESCSIHKSMHTYNHNGGAG